MKRPANIDPFWQIKYVEPVKKLTGIGFRGVCLNLKPGDKRLITLRAKWRMTEAPRSLSVYYLTWDFTYEKWHKRWHSNDDFLKQGDRTIWT